MKKHAFVIYAGPAETGRVFHALIHARQAQRRGDLSEIYFAAEGTGWPGRMAHPEHHLHSLFDDVRKLGAIKGACENCAVAFGNVDTAKAACGLVRGPVASDGQIDILGLHDAGFKVWLF